MQHRKLRACQHTMLAHVLPILRGQLFQEYSQQMYEHSILLVKDLCSSFQTSYPSLQPHLANLWTNIKDTTYNILLTFKIFREGYQRRFDSINSSYNSQCKDKYLLRKLPQISVPLRSKQYDGYQQNRPHQVIQQILHCLHSQQPLTYIIHCFNNIITHQPYPQSKNI